MSDGDLPRAVYRVLRPMPELNARAGDLISVVPGNRDYPIAVTVLCGPNLLHYALDDRLELATINMEDEYRQQLLEALYPEPQRAKRKRRPRKAKTGSQVIDIASRLA